MSMNVKMFGFGAVLIGAMLALSARATILATLDGGPFLSLDMIRLIVGVALFIAGVGALAFGFNLQEREDRESTDQRAS